MKFCISFRNFIIWHDLNGEKHTHTHTGYRFFKPGTHPKIIKHFVPHRKHTVNITNLIS